MCEEYRFNVEYFDSDGNIRADLFSEEAERIVKCFISKSSSADYQERRGRRQLKKKISSSQIRKFYEELLNLKTKLDHGSKFQEILPYFKMLKAKAHVAFERDVINANFKTFIEKNVDYVGEDEKRFKIFCTLFEAVVAYAKGTIKE